MRATAKSLAGRDFPTTFAHQWSPTPPGSISQLAVRSRINAICQETRTHAYLCFDFANKQENLLPFGCWKQVIFVRTRLWRLDCDLWRLQSDNIHWAAAAAAAASTAGTARCGKLQRPWHSLKRLFAVLRRYAPDLFSCPRPHTSHFRLALVLALALLR